MVTAEAMQIGNVDAATLRDWLARGEATLIDVREPFENAAERIVGAKLQPLGSLDAESLQQAAGSKRIVFHCRTGRRSLDAANRFARAVHQTAVSQPVYNLAGGIEAWKAAGLPVERSATAPPIDVMRQVQMTAGTLVLIGVLLGAFVSPWFLILSGFIGGGLLFAGASGWCGMAKLLALMPWNRGSGAAR